MSKEKRETKEHTTPGNGDRHEKNEQDLDGIRKEGPGQREEDQCIDSKGKSKILRYNKACTNPVTFDGENLKDVKTFTYLGSIIDEQGGSDADMKARICKARAPCLQLKNIWNSTNTKVTIFNTNVNTVLLYGVETRRTTKAII
ncbi:unnamed protein product [Schistosoma curassoni]|uniref:DUF6451 domain-containing protein n=1 Tax=Schistosoma curassoni TaxID=6186 RepID=A0A183KEW7_9TREM|nr:unnamed protein product [Schistosoma curassoni]